MTPQELDSFAFGFNLDSASYSGGAGGTFANIVSGGEAWEVQGATPTFSTQAGMEGMVFSNLAAESIFGEHRSMWECTIIATCYATTASSTYPYGGDYSAGNSYAMMMNAHKVQAYVPNASSGYPAAAASPNNVPHVMAVSFSPANGTTYAQIDLTTATQSSKASGSFTDVHVNWPTGAIGRHRTTYFTGWIGRVLVFDRSLHYRDNDNLQLLVESEMELVGL